MGLTIAYSKIKKRNLVLINNDTYQRETVSERPIRPPLMLSAHWLQFTSRSGQHFLKIQRATSRTNIGLFVLIWIHHLYISPGHRGIFFRGGKVIFPDFFPSLKSFFPVENSILVDPKQISVVLKSETKEEEKKKSSPHFVTFPPSIFNFPLSLFDFLSFLHFPSSLCLSLPGRSAEISSEQCQGALCPPASATAYPIMHLDWRPV